MPYAARVALSAARQKRPMSWLVASFSRAWATADTVVAVRPPLLVEEAVEGLGEFGGVGVRGHVAADGDREDLLALGLGVQAVGVDVTGVQAVLDVVHRVRHVVRPVHDLGLEAVVRVPGAPWRTQSKTGRSSS